MKERKTTSTKINPNRALPSVNRFRYTLSEFRFFSLSILFMRYFSFLHQFLFIPYTVFYRCYISCASLALLFLSAKPVWTQKLPIFCESFTFVLSIKVRKRLRFGKNCVKAAYKQIEAIAFTSNYRHISTTKIASLWFMFHFVRLPWQILPHSIFSQ